MHDLVPIEKIERKIHVIRGKKVMVDRDLAELYEVQTFNLNKAVKRNIQRFPQDFMFQLTKDEYNSLRFQFGMSNLRFQIGTSKRGGRRYLPFAFTEQGIAMLSSVLRSERSILVNIAIMRAFVELRQMLFTHKELSRKFKELESRVGSHDKQIRSIFDTIQRMLAIEEKPKKRIGFV